MDARTESPTDPSVQRKRADAHGPHRADIDGLRALAILPVVLYHAGVPGLPGGFVGVDIFFVISGFLIGGIVYKERRAAAFSLVNFYARRARRILPALFALMVAVCAAAALLLTPQETREFAKGALGVMAALSNVVFYLGSGYFAPAAETNPLLMTWSLGVEEQFYVLFPLLILLVARRGRWTSLAAVAAISAVSFTGSLVLTASNPQAAFYLLPTRAWELGIGAALAIWESGGETRLANPVVTQAKGLLGLVLMLGAILFYRTSIAFPGAFALLPTVGAALLISARTSVANRLLALPPLVFIGLVSYSWYLWHWPLLSFTHILLDGAPGLPLALAVVALSFVAAVASWRFVETPFRHRVATNPTALVRYGAVLLLLAAVPAVFYVAKGWPQRFSAPLQALSKDVEMTRADPCLAPYGQSAPSSGACAPAITHETVALLGDSHASALSPAVKTWANERGLGFVQLTKSSCPALYGFSRRVPEHPNHWRECEAFQRAAFQRVLSDPKISTVVLASYWSAGPDLETTASGADVHHPLGEALDTTLAALEAAHRKVVLLQDAPSLNFDPYPQVAGSLVPTRAALGGLLGAPHRDARLARQDQLEPDGEAPTVAAAAARHPGVRLIDPRRGLCDPQGCRFAGDTGLYYRDNQHLTASGARLALGELWGQTGR